MSRSKCFPHRRSWVWEVTDNPSALEERARKKSREEKQRVEKERKFLMNSSGDKIEQKDNITKYEGSVQKKRKYKVL